MKKILFYPIDYDNIFFVKNFCKYNNDDKFFFMTFRGTGAVGKGIDIFDKVLEEKISKVTILSDIEYNDILDEIDTIVYCKPWYEYDFYNDFVVKIIDALKRGKIVICNFTLKNKYIKKIKENITRKEMERLSYIKYNEDVSDLLDIKESEIMPLYDFDIPVITVVGLNKRTDKSLVTLRVYEQLREQGLKILSILPSGFGEIFGVYSYPQFMYENYSESKKIVMFNYYLKKLEKKGEYDAILIGVPGALFPANRKYTNYFGTQNFLVNRAVGSDASVCCLNYAEYEELYLDKVKNYINITLSSEVVGFTINNVMFDMYSSAGTFNLFSTVSIEILEKEIKKLKKYLIPVVNSKNEKELRKITQALIDIFSIESNIIRS